MKRSTIQAAFILGLMLLPAAGIAWLAWDRYENMNGAATASARQRAEAQGVLSALRAEADQASRHAARFTRLAVDGVVGPPDKLGLIDRFEQAVAPWHGEVVRYALASGRVAGSVGAERLQAHDLQVLSLSVELLPRHEVALLSMLDAIGTGIAGLHDIDRCEITRAGEAAEDGLKASCSIGVHVFVPRATAPLAGASR